MLKIKLKYILFLISLTINSYIYGCDGYKTYTQGGYGSKVAGNNATQYLHSNFYKYFPKGLNIGNNERGILLTTDTAVCNMLPSIKAPRVLNKYAVNPYNTSTSTNVFAGHIASLTLNIVFSYNDSKFGKPIGGLIINSGLFKNYTIQQLLDTSNKVISGGYSRYSVSSLSNKIDSINRNYDNGTVDNGWVDCVLNPLPVSLSSFYINYNNNSIELNWTTCSEINNCCFYIERSFDGDKFYTIGKVDGNGTTNIIHNYIYYDISLVDGQEYYYRLKQIDYNGQFEYSKIITFKIELKHPIYINNNTIVNTNLDVYNLSLYSIYGIILYSRYSINDKLYSLSDILSGIYILVIESNTILNKKLIYIK